MEVNDLFISVCGTNSKTEKTQLVVLAIPKDERTIHSKPKINFLPRMRCTLLVTELSVIKLISSSDVLVCFHSGIVLIII